MNPRRVHDLMRSRFPAFNAVEHEWVNMHDGKAPRIGELSELLERSIDEQEVVVEVHRKLGALLPIREAAAFIGSHIGEGQIRVADRAFKCFVVVALNGVATGWRMTDSIDDRADAHILLSNDQILEDITKDKVSASMMYATARFKSWVSACGRRSAEEMAAAKVKTIECCVEEYRKMLDENIDDFIDNFLSCMQGSKLLSPTITRGI